MSEDDRTTETSSDEVTTRPFADVFRELNKGRTHNEASLALQDLVAAVSDTGKAGTLTITLRIESAKSHGMVVVSDDVKLKKPQARAASLFYIDEEFNVRRDDPTQDELPGLVVAVPAPAAKRELRKAD